MENGSAEDEEAINLNVEVDGPAMIALLLRKPAVDLDAIGREAVYSLVACLYSEDFVIVLDLVLEYRWWI